jgi:hypothetical protein
MILKEWLVVMYMLHFLKIKAKPYLRIRKMYNSADLRRRKEGDFKTRDCLRITWKELLATRDSDDAVMPQA